MEYHCDSDMCQKPFLVSGIQSYSEKHGSAITDHFSLLKCAISHAERIDLGAHNFIAPPV